MGLRSDSSLWFNLPGVVAAYQPVRAPGPMLARYNMANGGDNRYKAAIQNAEPAWNGRNGWSFNGSSAWNIGVTHNGTTFGDTWSAIVRYVTTADGQAPYLSNYYYWKGFSVWSGNQQGTYNWCTSTKSYQSAQRQVSLGSKTVQGLSGITGYVNGRAYATLTASTTAYTGVLYIGYGIAGGAYLNNSTIQAVTIYNRTLSASEMWTASLQMAYCDVNPDWSAWGRRRKWYYAAEVVVPGATLQIQGRNLDVVIG